VTVLLELVVEDLLAAQAEPVPVIDSALLLDREVLPSVLEACSELGRMDVVVVVHDFAPVLIL
jgi:hypothetical protein